MKIINSYRGGALPEPNTFIGGVGATSVTSMADFVALTGGIIAANISNFQIDSNNNVSFFCDSAYTLDTDAFNGDTALTYYIDEKCTTINSGCFKGLTDATYFYFPNVISTSIQVWQFKDDIDVISIPLCTPIGGAVGADGCFASADRLQYVITHADNETNNGGNPDGDLTEAGADIQNIKYVANTTAPSDITDLTVDDFLGTAISISWSAPSTTNPIIYYELWLDGAFIELQTSTSKIISGLSFNTSYEIKIKTLDEFGNRGESNVVNQTTAATYQIPTGDIVSYYPLNTNSDDSVGTNDGTDTSVNYTTDGIVGKSVDFTAGNTSNIEIADDNSLSFGNGTTDSSFTFSTWVKFSSISNGAMFSKRKADSSEQEYIFTQATGFGTLLRLTDASSSGLRDVKFDWTPTLNQWYFLVVTFNGTTGIIYIDAVAQSTTNVDSGSYTAMENGIGTLAFGKYQNTSSVSLDGFMDETAIFDIELTAVQIIEIKAKNDANLGLTE